jgi:hypothetical protein
LQAKSFVKIMLIWLPYVCPSSQNETG